MALIKIRRGRWQYDGEDCVGLALDLVVYDDDGRPALMPYVVEGEALAAVLAEPERLKDIVLKLGSEHLAGQEGGKTVSDRPVDLIAPEKYEPSPAEIVEATINTVDNKKKVPDGSKISTNLG